MDRSTKKLFLCYNIAADSGWALNSAVECHLHTSSRFNTFNNLTGLPGTAKYLIIRGRCVDLRACDLQLTNPFQVRLFGKGRKERFCPLWPQTAAVLRAFCKERNLNLRSEARLFLNHRGEP